MHDQTVTDRFILLRSQGWTLSRLMSELNVSKPTLIAWSRKFQFEIQNYRAIEMDALRDKWLASTTARVDALGAQLRKVEDELATRDIAELSTGGLLKLADSLRKRIGQETAGTQFVFPTREIPAEEYYERVQCWTP
jgi:hypothetical protein